MTHAVPHFRRFRLAALLAALMLAMTVNVASATTAPIGVWKLLGNVSNSKGAPPSLTLVGAPHFQNVNVAGTNRSALVLQQIDGILLAGIPTAARSTYTVEIWFEMDDTNGTRRLISFGPESAYNGLVIVGSRVDLIPGGSTAGEFVPPDHWTKLRVTRSGTTKTVKVYVNGVLRLSYHDVGGAYLLGQGQMLVFGQAYFYLEPSGTLARVKLWDRVVAP